MIAVRVVWLAIAALPAFAMAGPTTRDTHARPDLKSNAVLIVDANDASVVYQRKADDALPIASLTKLMTSLVVLDGGQPLDEVIEIVKADRDGTNGVASRLTIGAKLTRGDLLHLALMASDNRAAHALAREYPGGVDAFVHAMNAKARALGMTKTHFEDSSGLSPRNVASATDLSKLVLAASDRELIRQFSTDGHHSVQLAKQQVEFRNTNYLVNRPEWRIELQKTGYTGDAGQCLVMKTVIEGRSLVIVLLDSFGKYTRTADARRIRKWLEAKAPI